MRLVHIALGALLICLAAGSVVAGVYLLRASEGGGLRVVVAFDDASGLAVDDSVLYGDKLVGRVESIEGGEATARVSAEHSGFLREGSRFWIQSNLGTRFLCFDSPPDAGAAAQPGKRFVGLSARPEPHPSMLPSPVARRMPARPAWLCDVRVVSTFKEGDELVRDVARRSAGIVVYAREGSLLVLAPAWLLEAQFELVSRRARVELAGGEVCTAQPAQTGATLCVLLVEGSTWQGQPAALWPDALADGQGLLLADFEGQAWTARLQGGLEFRGALEAGQVALVDGLNPCGFALPQVGERKGARWEPLTGAGTLIDRARAEWK